MTQSLVLSLVYLENFRNIYCFGFCFIQLYLEMSELGELDANHLVASPFHYSIPSCAQVLDLSCFFSYFRTVSAKYTLDLFGYAAFRLSELAQASDAAASGLFKREQRVLSENTGTVDRAQKGAQELRASLRKVSSFENT